MNMAKAILDVFEIEAPQYVDFENELDSSAKDDIFFASSKRSLCTPEIQGKEKGLTESDENRLLGKMAAALSILENTPKVKKSASRGKLFFEDQSAEIIKPKTVPRSQPKLRTSKSLDHLNKIISEKIIKKKGCGIRKSSSLHDFRSQKLKYPITPMCLKRTIVKAKERMKSTEEMELEHIAGLQKLLIQHLRQNEISLRKLNLRPRQHTVPKAPPRSENLKDLKGGNVVAEKTNAAEKEPRKNIHMLCRAPMKKRAPLQDTVTNKESALNEKPRSTIYSRKPKAFLVSTTDLGTYNSTSNQAASTSNQAALKEKPSKLDVAVNTQNTSRRKTIYSQKPKLFVTSSTDVNKPAAQKTKKLTHKRILDHSGIIFVPSGKNNSTIKPIFFETKGKEMKQQVAGLKQKETSVLNAKENFDKENKDCTRPQSAVKKRQETQNAKCDINKLAELNKVTGKRITNPMRSAPLSENVARN